MRSGKCPKCGAASVHAARGGFHWGSGRGVHISTSAVSVGIELDTYICASCGYLEHYVPDPQKLAEVAQTWGRVAPPADPAPGG